MHVERITQLRVDLTMPDVASLLRSASSPAEELY